MIPILASLKCVKIFKPWEIFVSESQERMSLVIEDKHIEALFDLLRGLSCSRCREAARLEGQRVRVEEDDCSYLLRSEGPAARDAGKDAVLHGRRHSHRR